MAGNGISDGLNSGREITADQRTMSGQNAELSGQILTVPVILTAVTFGKRTN
jgi:hypothetical protein